MFLITVVATLLVCAQAAVLPKVPTLDGKIVGGSVADITEAPYQVALLYNIVIGSFDQVCGGSIITRDVVVTSGRCTRDSTASQWKIRAGSTQHNSGGQVIDVSRFVQHPNFNSRLDNDISLMFLSASLVLSTSVATISLPSQGMTVADGTSALITGWGSLSQSDSFPIDLHKVNIPIVNQQDCIEAHATFLNVTDNMICAGRLFTGGADACYGDEGGPLVIDNLLIGITSWGNGCAQAGYPGVWTRVPNYVDWINANL